MLITIDDNLLFLDRVHSSTQVKSHHKKINIRDNNMIIIILAMDFFDDFLR